METPDRSAAGRRSFKPRCENIAATWLQFLQKQLWRSSSASVFAGQSYVPSFTFVLVKSLYALCILNIYIFQNNSLVSPWEKAHNNLTAKLCTHINTHRTKLTTTNANRRTRQWLQTSAHKHAHVCKYTCTRARTHAHPHAHTHVARLEDTWRKWRVVAREIRGRTGETWLRIG